MVKGVDLGDRYGCTVEVVYTDRTGRLARRITELTYWSVIALSAAQAKNLGRTLRVRPLRTWPRASSGNNAIKAHPKATIIWGPRAHGMALFGTTLGSGPL